MAEYILPRQLQDYIVAQVPEDESRDTSLWLVKILGDTLAQLELRRGSGRHPGISYQNYTPANMRAYDIAGKIVCFLLDPVKTDSYREDARVMRLSWQHFEADELAKNRFKVLVDKVVEEYGPACMQVRFWVQRRIVLQLIQHKGEAPRYKAAGMG